MSSTNVVVHMNSLSWSTFSLLKNDLKNKLSFYTFCSVSNVYTTEGLLEKVTASIAEKIVCLLVT